jgi:hypothetical protein
MTRRHEHNPVAGLWSRAPGRTEVGRNLITHRMFEGGSLKVVAAKS